MATAPAAKKSRQRASRSGTTTASRAKPEANDAEWSARDQESAQQQGWGVFECIDMSTRKIFFEVQAHGERFAHDGLARSFVMDQNKAGEELAIKALRVVFRSKAGTQGRA